MVLLLSAGLCKFWQRLQHFGIVFCILLQAHYQDDEQDINPAPAVQAPAKALPTLSEFPSLNQAAATANSAADGGVFVRDTLMDALNVLKIGKLMASLDLRSQLKSVACCLYGITETLHWLQGKL